MHSVKGYRWSQAPRWNPKCVAFQSAKGAVMASISQSNVISGQNEKLIGIVSQSCWNRRRGWNVIL